jgi:hypothetical protein
MLKSERAGRVQMTKLNKQYDTEQGIYNMAKREANWEEAEQCNKNMQHIFQAMCDLDAEAQQQGWFIKRGTYAYLVSVRRGLVSENRD